MMGRVTHEEVRILLPSYAGGLLSMADAESVRLHLASGCAECLDVLYRMPVGMPRAVETAVHERAAGVPMDAIPPPAGPATGTSRAWLPRVLGLVVFVALVAWILTLWGAPLFRG
jgi:hypothetical protein